MRILHTVESYYPAVGGMAEVVRQLSERLVVLGHDVVVATRHDPGRLCKEIRGVRVEEFAVSGNLATGIYGDTDSYRAFLLGSHFDIVTNFAAQQWATDVMLTFLEQVAGRKVFVPTGFSNLHNPDYRDYFARMPGWMRSYDMTILTGMEYRDAIFARSHGINNVIMIPNGAAAEEFFPAVGADIRGRLDIPKDHFLILHVGSHTGMKGHEEAIAIFAGADISDATLLMVGTGSEGCYAACRARETALNRSDVFRRRAKRLLIADLCRADTVAAFNSADLFLFPSAIECSPIVLFESMASRTPFLVTDVGNAREIVDWSGGGMLLATKRHRMFEGDNGNVLSRLLDICGCGRREANPLESYVQADVRSSASLLTDLRNDPERRMVLAQSGFSAWQQRFTWELIASRYEKLYQMLLSNTGTNVCTSIGEEI